jgi:putative transposase
VGLQAHEKLFPFSGFSPGTSMPLAPQEQRTFFVTSITHERHAIFQSTQMAELLIDVLVQNRRLARFLLHEFVVMPEHFHVLFTPSHDVSLEKAVQYIKGGFSFRARKELGYVAPIWQRSFTSHRVSDAPDYERHRNYIQENPVKRFLTEQSEAFPYSSAHPQAETDPMPPWLKPALSRAVSWA